MKFDASSLAVGIDIEGTSLVESWREVYGLYGGISLFRTDAAGSIRQLMQQCHAVLKDHGCVMLLDKAKKKWGNKIEEHPKQSEHVCQN